MAESYCDSFETYEIIARLANEIENANPFGDKFLIWALGKTIRHPASKLCKSYDQIRSLALQFKNPSHVCENTYNRYSELVELILKNDLETFKEKTKVKYNKVVVAAAAIWFNRLDFIPDITTLTKIDSDFITRLLCLEHRSLDNIRAVVGQHKTGFSFIKLVSYSAGAAGNKILCKNLFEIYPDYIGFIIAGAEHFRNEKLAVKFETILTGKSFAFDINYCHKELNIKPASKEPEMIISISWFILLFLCFLMSYISSK